MAYLYEGVRNAAFIISEANNTRSREQIILATAAGNNLSSGTVLGKITASGKYTALTPGATDGSQTAIAVLYWNTDASAADQRTVGIVRDAEVDYEMLIWPAGITDAQKTSAINALATASLIVRNR